MPMIRVEMYPGRTLDQKRALVRNLTQAFVDSAGGKPESVQVVLIEVAQDDWASAGVLASDKAKG